VFIFHDGVPYWLVAIVASIAAFMVVVILGGMAWRRAGSEAQRPIRVLGAMIDEAFTAGGTPLGTTVRRWTIGLFAAGVLFGPLGYGELDFVPVGWPRIAVLVLAPVALGIALIWFWKSWRPDRAGEVHFGRVVAELTAGALLIGSVLMSQRTSHIECAQSVQTYDGSECVGEDIVVPGADEFQVLVLAGLAATALWFAAVETPWAEAKPSTRTS
jgi:hypothetical protein